MVSSDLTDKVKQTLLADGADLVGVAPMERFAHCPAETHPRHYMPDATCVISIGVHILDGVCDVWDGDPHTPHKSASPYLFYGYGLLNMELGRLAYRAARMLEYGGHKSLAFPPTWLVGKYRFLEGTIERGESPADFSHRHAAVAAGLGEFGLNGLVLTGFGTRNRFNSILTNAPLTADPMYDGPPLCRPEVCNRKCVRTCPTRAFDCEKMLTADYGERRFQYPYVKKPRCILGAALGLVKGTGGYSDLELNDDDEITSADVKEILANASVAQKKLLACVQGIIVGDFCGLCQHGCPAHQWARKECPADSPARGPQA